MTPERSIGCAALTGVDAPIVVAFGNRFPTSCETMIPVESYEFLIDLQVELGNLEEAFPVLAAFIYAYYRHRSGRPVPLVEVLIVIALFVYLAATAETQHVAGRIARGRGGKGESGDRGQQHRVRQPVRHVEMPAQRIGESVDSGDRRHAWESVPNALAIR